MSEPTPLRIRPKLYQEMKDEMPEIFTDTTTWGNYLLRVGLNVYLGLDAYGKLKTDRHKEKKEKEREVFYTSKVENIINKEAYQLLIGSKGLGGICKQHGQNAVKDQLEEAIANKWQSITLKNYEAYGRPQKADKEPVTGHPAGRVFRNGRFVDE